MEFDNDGKVVALINQKIEHNNLDDISLTKMCYIPTKDDVIKFVWSYLKTHKYCSKKFLAGLCVGEFHPLLPRSQKNIQRNFKRKISIFFAVLKKLGLASQFNNNTIRVHTELKNDYSLDDIYKLYNENIKGK